jgi:diamine N-acetyltransferase
MVGNEIHLIPLDEEHIETVRVWRNDPDIRKYYFSWQTISKFQQKKWYERYANNDSQLVFAIVDNDTEEFIGTIALYKIDHFHQNAELSTLIGNKAYWGKGIATSALRLLCEYAFNDMNLNRIYTYVLKNNIGSIKKNEKNGFKIEGTLRKHVFNQGSFQDVVVMGLLKEDFR